MLPFVGLMFFLVLSVSVLENSVVTILLKPLNCHIISNKNNYLILFFVPKTLAAAGVHGVHKLPVTSSVCKTPFMIPIVRFSARKIRAAMSIDRLGHIPRGRG